MRGFEPKTLNIGEQDFNQQGGTFSNNTTLTNSSPKA